MQQFQLTDEQEFIELFKLLKAIDWAASGGEAKQMIDAGMVSVNQQVETRKRNKIKSGDLVSFQEHQVQVI
ncbi:RNA-binding S4 domain-containing protein [Paraferrimonas haliotis]|uniref:S4 RNA-binding domain protein n=1 Tax=Paraferrimonas haliotis TaxID=2013866 RepID=A0AA37TLH9_9GAMM|nr:RNA-binding S4 domain-containing protein [Paraferrimonas haliotis]GLS82663.1 S4 RNA-binding domain protein [Paraferrimonas haliotis]